MKTNNQQSLNRWIKPGSFQPWAGNLSVTVRTFVFAVAVVAILIAAGSAHADWRIIDHPDAGETYPRGVSGNTVVGHYYTEASPEPFSNQNKYPRVGDAMFNKLHQPFMINSIEKAADIGIEHPAHLSSCNPNPDRIQRFMLVTFRPKTVAKTKKCFLIDLV